MWSRQWIDEPDGHDATRPAPGPAADPLAAALANATLLGVGYLLLRRWKTAAAAVMVTAVLALIMTGQPGWIWRAILLLWGAATVIHAWSVAGGRMPARPRPADEQQPLRSRWQRIVAAAAVAAVWLAILGVELDARRIEADAVAAHRAGNCDDTLQTLERISSWHRAVDPRVSHRTVADAEACKLLEDARAATEDRLFTTAASALRDYVGHPAGRWGGAADLRADMLLEAASQDLDRSVLDASFDTLTTVLAETPDRAADVRAVVADYLDQLPTMSGCSAKSDLEALRELEPTGTVLDQELAALTQIEPSILVACADDLLDSDATRARDTYQLMLDRYPDHPLADRAVQGIADAELPVVRRLLAGWPDPGLAVDMDYCADPSRYGQAPAYTGPGPHRVVDASTLPVTLPSEWLATDFTDAVLVLCASGSLGSELGTCDYFYEDGRQETLDLRAQEYTIVTYELRTGEPVAEVTMEFGDRCPQYPRSPTGELVSGIRTHTYPAIESDAILAAIEPWIYP